MAPRQRRIKIPLPWDSNNYSLVRGTAGRGDNRAVSVPVSSTVATPTVPTDMPEPAAVSVPTAVREPTAMP